MAAVYIPEKKLFSYCHWWNSVTSKKYRYTWKKVSPDLVLTLLANYSFNDRPIHYFEVKTDGDQVQITKEKVFSRPPGCTEITLVPGGSKGKFPSQDSSDMGFVEVDNISIAWPKKRSMKTSAPITQLVEGGNESGQEGYVRKLKKVNSSVYHSSYIALTPGIKYTIVSAGVQRYRGHIPWNFITQCGLQVRAGKSLRKIWEDWMYGFKENGCMDPEKTKWMKFKAVRKITIHGVDDMKCKLA